VLAVCAGALTAGTVHRAEEVRAAYGEVRTVAVARSDVEPGRVLGPDDVRWAPWPVALVPADAASDPEGRVVAEPLAAGEVVLERRLGAGDGPTGLLEPGRRAVAVPLDAAPAGLAAGDRVDAYAPTVAASSTELTALVRDRAGARRVASSALVVAVDERAATLAVSSGEAAAVAQSVLDGAVVLAVVAPG